MAQAGPTQSLIDSSHLRWSFAFLRREQISIPCAKHLHA